MSDETNWYDIELQLRDDGSTDKQVHQELALFSDIVRIFDDALNKKRDNMLGAVLKLHEPVTELIEDDYGSVSKCNFCKSCSDDVWPCPTAQVMIEAYWAT